MTDSTPATAAPWCPSIYRTATCLIAAGHDGGHAGNDLDGRWLRWTDDDVRRETLTVPLDGHTR